MVPVAVTRASARYRGGLGPALTEAGFEPVEPDDAQEWAESTDPATVLVLIEEAEDWSTLEGLASLPHLVVVALLPDHQIESYRRALASGADGAINADSSPELIAHVLQAAMSGETALPTEAARQLAQGQRPSPSPLTQEEADLIRLLIEGLTHKQMAERTNLSDRTLRRRLQSAYLKLGAANKNQAIARAAALGLAD